MKPLSNVTTPWENRRGGVEHTLDNHKRKILGAVSCDRDSYNPGSILNTINSGDMVRVLDSNTLPQDWIDINPRDIMVQSGSNQARERLEQLAFSDDGASSEVR